MNTKCAVCVGLERVGEGIKGTCTGCLQVRRAVVMIHKVGAVVLEGERWRTCCWANVSQALHHNFSYSQHPLGAPTNVLSLYHGHAVKEKFSPHLYL